MVDLVVSPLSFSPTKVGYKQYVKAGGAMQLASFMVFERRTKKEVLIDKSNRTYNAMNYHYDMFFYYNSIGDEKASKIHWESMEIRAKQHREIMQSLCEFN
jgi:hypothetical protein